MWFFVVVVGLNFDISQKGLPENFKKCQYLHIIWLNFCLNKFLQIILCMLIMLHLWHNVATKKHETGLPHF